MPLFFVAADSAWGGNPEKDARYLNVTTEKNDIKTVHKLDVKDVLADGFWSISVYNSKGYFEPNPENAYTLNNITAKKNSDGSVAIQFGGCETDVPNCLPVNPGWNYLVRLYRPRPQVLNGEWSFHSRERQTELRCEARPFAPGSRPSLTELGAGLLDLAPKLQRFWRLLLSKWNRRCLPSRYPSPHGRNQ